MGADEAGTAQALREHLTAIAPIVTSHGDPDRGSTSSTKS
jgi:hypothetical protein